MEENGKPDHITPFVLMLCRLHALASCAAADILQSRRMVYQCVRGLGPAYLANALQPVAEMPGRQRLRSSSTSVLDVPLTRLSTGGNRAFPVATARIFPADFQN